MTPVYPKYITKARQAKIAGLGLYQAEVAAVIVRFGREICSETEEGQAEYRARVLRMLTRQGSLCCICGLFCSEEEATFEHGDLRGMGGGRRNDSEFAPGNGAAHGRCNTQKGSVRGGER